MVRATRAVEQGSPHMRVVAAPDGTRVEWTRRSLHHFRRLLGRMLKHGAGGSLQASEKRCSGVPLRERSLEGVSVTGCWPALVH